MSEMILPGVYIEVRPEGLIAPGQITVGNVGVVGTAAKGPINTPVLLSSFTDAKRNFYEYDPWLNPSTGKPNQSPLTLVRALELVFNFGATTVYAVRVTGMDNHGNTKAVKAHLTPQTAGANCVKLAALTEGTWGNDLSLDVIPAQTDAFIEDEPVPVSGPGALKLTRKVKQGGSPRNRVSKITAGVTTLLNVVNDAAPAAGKNQVGLATTGANAGQLSFAAGEAPAASDQLIASYVVGQPDAVTVTLHLDRAQEVYTVADGNQLRDLMNDQSAWVSADTTGCPAAGKLPSLISPDTPALFAGGDNAANVSNTGQPDADYEGGLNTLLNQEVHIVVAAGQVGVGQDFPFGNKLDAHCQKASTDAIKHDRIAVVGTALAEPNRRGDLPTDPNNQEDTFFEKVIGHNLDSDRVILVAPGIKATDTSMDPAEEVTLPGAYTAAAVAGLLASFPPHISLTNKTLPVDDLEVYWDDAHLTQLVQNRVLGVEKRQGFHVVKGITTTTGSAFTQITTRRIVDYAKFGVRSAASPYIGLLNNERVRAALRATINSFLAGMVQDEMLISYDLSVTATRDEEIKGIANVTMTLQPTFSIDFIKVTMFLQ